MAQLVGRQCIHCGERIPSELEARFCRTCGSAVHNQCVRVGEGRACPDCGADVALPVKFSEAIPAPAGGLEPAGFWIRLLAYVIDAIILFPISAASTAIFLSVKSLPLSLLIGIPGLLYKPLMESRYGATLGKLVCRIMVVDGLGSRLRVRTAYIRFAPWLLQAIVGIATIFWLYSVPQFQEVSGFLELGRVMQASPLIMLFSRLAGFFLLIDCGLAAFTDRKRAIHDMIAESYCVWRAD